MQGQRTWTQEEWQEFEKTGLRAGVAGRQSHVRGKPIKEATVKNDAAAAKTIEFPRVASQTAENRSADRVKACKTSNEKTQEASVKTAMASRASNVEQKKDEHWQNYACLGLFPTVNGVANAPISSAARTTNISREKTTPSRNDFSRTSSFAESTQPVTRMSSTPLAGQDSSARVEATIQERTKEQFGLRIANSGSENRTQMSPFRS